MKTKIENIASGAKNLAINLALIIASLGICFVVLEYALRTFAFNPNYSYIRPPGWTIQVNTNNLLPNVKDDHLYVTNRLGFRGELPNSRSNPKIAVVGASAVEDWVLSTDATWPQQLASRLRNCAPDVWVANLGRAGVNIRHNILQLEAVLDYMPEFDIIVVLSGINDFFFDYHVHHSFEVKDGWWKAQAFSYVEGDEGSFAVLAIARRLWKNYQEKSSLPVSNFGDFMKALRTAFRNVKDDQWVNKLPEKPEALRNYQKNIMKLHAISQAYGAKIVFATQPYVWSDTMTQITKDQLFAGFIGPDMNSPETKWYTPKALWEGSANYNDAMRQLCSAEGLHCVDVAAKLPREPKYFFDEVHFSNAGAAKVGEIVADALKPHITSCQR